MAPNRWPLMLLLLVCLSQPSDSAVRSSRYSSYRSSSRYTRYSASSAATVIRSSFSRSVTRSAIRTSVYLASARWMSRVYRESDDRAEYTICFNAYDALPAELNTTDLQPWLYKSVQVYGAFACPLGEDDGFTYCCGDTNRERCCGFWDVSENVVNVAVGSAFGAVALAVFGYFVYKIFLKKACCSSSSVQPAPSVSEAANGDSQMQARKFDDFDNQEFGQDCPPPPKYEDVV